MKTDSTLARRIAEALRNNQSGLGGERLLAVLPQPRPSSASLRATVTRLAAEGTIGLQRLTAAEGDLDFVANFAEQSVVFLDDAGKLPYVGDEILEELYRREQETRRSSIHVTALEGILCDLTPQRIQVACEFLVEKGWVKPSLGDNKIFAIRLESGGRERVERVSGSLASTSTTVYAGDHYEFSGSHNAAIINSPFAQQRSQASSTSRPQLVREVADSIRLAIAQLPNIGFAASAAQKINTHLEDSVSAIEEDEPDFDYAESCLRRALRVGAQDVQAVGKLADSLATAAHRIGVLRVECF